jgi:excisionase family DNA binding protein
MMMLLTEARHRSSQSIEDFITVEEAVAQTGYTGQYLRRMARAGRIRALKRGPFWLIELASLQAYLAAARDTADGRFGPRELRE